MNELSRYEPPPPEPVPGVEFRWAAHYRSGGVTHAVRPGEAAAVCGATPGTGWAPGRADGTDCAKCRRRLGLGVRPPRVTRRLAPEGGGAR